MKVREIIKKLERKDPEAEVVCFEPEYGFFSAAYVYPAKMLKEYDDWVSVHDAPKPKKVVLIA